MKMVSVVRGFLLIFFCAAVPVGSALAELRIDITRGNVQPLPIAVTDFFGSETGPQISSVIASDLESSGLFAPR